MVQESIEAVKSSDGKDMDEGFSSRWPAADAKLVVKDKNID